MASFITLTEAYTYFSTRLGAESWDCASESNKTKALATASSLINQLNFSGCKPDGQVLHFPLNGEDEIPQDIKNATAELALELLSGRDPDLEFEASKLVSARYGDISSTYQQNANIPPHVLAGIPSLRAWRLLQKYLADPFSIRLYRSS